MKTTDLLTVENVSLKWSSIARLAWRSHKILNISGVPNVHETKEILDRAGKYIKTLNLQEYTHTDQTLELISGYLPRLEKMIFSNRMTITDRQLLKIFSNLENMHQLVDASNVVDVMRLGSKLRLHSMTALAVTIFLEVEDDDLFSECDTLNLLEQLQRSERIFLRSHYPWTFRDFRLNLAHPHKSWKRALERNIFQGPI